MTSKEMEYILNNDLSEYEGQWIAVKGKEVIASNSSQRELYDKVKEKEGYLIHKVRRSDVVYI